MSIAIKTFEIRFASRVKLYREKKLEVFKVEVKNLVALSLQTYYLPRVKTKIK
jgi:hypothetical protein